MCVGQPADFIIAVVALREERARAVEAHVVVGAAALLRGRRLDRKIVSARIQQQTRDSTRSSGFDRHFLQRLEPAVRPERPHRQLRSVGRIDAEGVLPRVPERHGAIVDRVAVTDPFAGDQRTGGVAHRDPVRVGQPADFIIAVVALRENGTGELKREVAGTLPLVGAVDPNRTGTVEQQRFFEIQHAVLHGGFADRLAAFVHHGDLRVEPGKIPGERVPSRQKREASERNGRTGGGEFSGELPEIAVRRALLQREAPEFGRCGIARRVAGRDLIAVISGGLAGQRERSLQPGLIGDAVDGDLVSGDADVVLGGFPGDREASAVDGDVRKVRENRRFDVGDPETLRRRRLAEIAAGVERPERIAVLSGPERHGE